MWCKESFPSQHALADVCRLGKGDCANAGACLARRVMGEAKHVLPRGTPSSTALTREEMNMGSWNGGSESDAL